MQICQGRALSFATRHTGHYIKISIKCSTEVLVHVQCTVWSNLTAVCVTRGM